MDCKVPVSVVRFDEAWIFFLTDVRKNAQITNFMKICKSVQWKSNCSMRTDGQTWRRYLSLFAKFTNAPKGSSPLVWCHACSLFKYLLRQTSSYATRRTTEGTGVDYWQGEILCSPQYPDRPWGPPLLLAWPALAAGSSTGLTNTWCSMCVLSSWWWTEKPSETCRASYRNK